MLHKIIPQSFSSQKTLLIIMKNKNTSFCFKSGRKTVLKPSRTDSRNSVIAFPAFTSLMSYLYYLCWHFYKLHSNSHVSDCFHVVFFKGRCKSVASWHQFTIKVEKYLLWMKWKLRSMSLTLQRHGTQLSFHP